VEARPYLVLDLLPGVAAVDRTGIRVARTTDLPAMAAVMADAYRGTVDDEGEDPPAALRELEATATGAHGPALEHAWLVYEDDAGLSAAVVCTRWQGRPLVAYAFTHPSRQRRGISRRLLLSAAGELARAGEAQLSLIVTRRNPAHELYLRIGFAERPWPAGT